MSQARIWVISDTHFGHENMYKFVSFDGVTRVRKEFESSQDGDYTMVANWNAVVRPEDHVYHLGDVCMDTSRHLGLVRHLLGHKRLVLGNHDKGKMTEYIAAGFQKIMSSRQFEGFLLSHIPLHPDSLGGRINVHGHLHRNPTYGPQYRNVSVECINYTPVLLDELRNKYV